MELLKKTSILYTSFLLLILGIGVSTSYAQCPNNCQIEVRILENCENGRIKFIATTQGEFLGWTTSSGDTSTIENNKSLNTIVNPTQSTTYIAQSRHKAENLLQNGSFDSNDQLFTTDYTTNDSVKFTTGNYAIVQNSLEVSPVFVNRTDHTINNGFMLIVDGSEDTSKSFFTQKINIVEGKNYQFTVFAANIHQNLTGTTDKSGNNSAKIGLFINGVYLKSKSLPHDTSWTEFTYKWKATFTGETTLQLKDKNSKLKENDFAVDDISFAEIFIDSVSILVTPCSSSKTFSPNGDGQFDTYFIADSGTARIYSSNGKLIQTLQTPGYWDGKTNTGQNAPTDYYAIIIDSKKVKHVTLMR